MKNVCVKCGKEYETTDLRWRCSCGGCLICDYSYPLKKADIKTERHNMWRYDAAYPLKYEELQVTYNEGYTPLVPYREPSWNLRIKLDSLMPTGSFKDRATVMIINQLLKNGAHFVTEDSSGNAGASVAFYCALGGIPCEIYVPSDTSPDKVSQIMASGAKVFCIQGTREEVALAAQKNSANYAGHNWHPFYLQGLKSIAYELWEQNGFRAPKNIVAVTGNGGEILGMYLGFRDLYQSKEIDAIPRIFAVQADNCNPIYRAFKNLPPLEEGKPTLAEGTALLHPCKLEYLVKTLNQYGGEVLSVSEQEICDALITLAHHGFYLEPTSAAAFAGLTKLYNSGVLKKEDEVVMMASGNGLKANNIIRTLLSLKTK